VASVPTVGYAERLVLPWWLWPPALGLAALLAAEVHLGGGGVRAWLPYAVLLPATAAGLWWLGRIRVAVQPAPDGGADRGADSHADRGAELRVDDARLPVRFVADAVPLDAAGKREILGPYAHPLAFVVQRPWIGGVVQVVLDDPADPTPYWVVSSRCPERLAAALLAARVAARPDRPAAESRATRGEIAEGTGEAD
jgi:hypothetical protein